MPKNFPVLSSNNHCSYQSRAGRTSIATLSSRSYRSCAYGVWEPWDSCIWIYVPGLFLKTNIRMLNFCIELMQLLMKCCNRINLKLEYLIYCAVYRKYNNLYMYVWVCFHQLFKENRVSMFFCFTAISFMPLVYGLYFIITLDWNYIVNLFFKKRGIVNC